MMKRSLSFDHDTEHGADAKRGKYANEVAQRDPSGWMCEDMWREVVSFMGVEEATFYGFPMAHLLTEVDLLSVRRLGDVADAFPHLRRLSLRYVHPDIAVGECRGLEHLHTLEMYSGRECDYARVLRAVHGAGARLRCVVIESGSKQECEESVFTALVETTADTLERLEAYYCAIGGSQLNRLRALRVLRLYHMRGEFDAEGFAEDPPPELKVLELILFTMNNRGYRACCSIRGLYALAFSHIRDNLCPSSYIVEGAAAPTLRAVANVQLCPALYTRPTVPMDRLPQLTSLFIQSFDFPFHKSDVFESMLLSRTLQELNAPYSKIDVTGIQKIVTKFPCLRELKIAGNPIDGECMVLIQKHLYNTLKILDVSNCPGICGGCHVFERGFPFLKILRILQCQLDTNDMQLIFENLPAGMRALIAGHNQCKDYGVDVLRRAPCAATLRTLDLHNNGISPVGIEMLFNDIPMPHLTALDMGKNTIDSVDRLTIAGVVDTLPMLDQLIMGEMQLTDGHLLPVIEKLGPQLFRFDIADNNPVTNDTFHAIGTYMKNLKHLTLGDAEKNRLDIDTSDPAYQAMLRNLPHLLSVVGMHRVEELWSIVGDTRELPL